MGGGRRGRRTREEMLATDARPGQILALGLLANAPLFAGFVLAPLFGDISNARAFVPWVLWLTAPLALASGILYFATAKPRRAHRAARIGLLLAVVALVMWVLVLLLWMRASAATTA